MNQDRGHHDRQTQSFQMPSSRIGGQDSGSRSAHHWEAGGHPVGESGHLAVGRPCTGCSLAYDLGQHPGRSPCPYCGPGPSLALSLFHAHGASGLLAVVPGCR